MFSRERYRWNITSVLPPFRSRGTFVAVLFWSTPECFAFTISVPRLQRHRYWWAILQAMAVDSFLLGRKGDPAVLLFPSRTCSEFIAFNPGQVLGTVLQYFSVIFRFPLKTVQRFRNFLAVLPPPTLYKVETRKKFWIHASNIVCGVRGGVGPVWIGKRPRNAKVSQDFCPWLSDKKVGRKKVILRGFQACKSVFSGSWWKIVIEQIFSQLFRVF